MNGRRITELVFPQTVALNETDFEDAPGLTKREYFAAEALSACANGRFDCAEDAARQAVLYADALIKELSK